MRNFHRWIGLPAALFLAFIALTGTLLQLDMIRVGGTPPGSEPERPAASQTLLPTKAVMGEMIFRVVDTAQRANPSLQIEKVELNFTGPQITGTAGSALPFGPHVKVNAATGAIITEPKPKADYHFILQDLHAGYYFGWTGRIISILCGLSLLIISLTGLKTYWDMLSRRRAAGKKGMFWK